MTLELWLYLLCFVFVGYSCIRESRPKPFDNSEREGLLQQKQFRLSHAMKKRGTHLLAGKHYRPVLTRTMPVTEKPKLRSIR